MFEEPDWAELTCPRLSVIRQPVRAIAREAWELLLRRMNNEAFPVQRLELHAEIELRESVQTVSARPRPFLRHASRPPGDGFGECVLKCFKRRVIVSPAALAPNDESATKSRRNAP